MSRVKLLTHLRFEDGKPFIGSAFSMTEKPFPAGRITGYFGIQSHRRALPFLWRKSNSLYDRDLSKVEIFINDNGKVPVNQCFEDLDQYDILNILLAQMSITDRLDEWLGDKSKTKSRSILDRPVFRKIADHPEHINTLFDRPELAHIKAIIWGIHDSDNLYTKVVTVRDLSQIESIKLFNYNDSVKPRFKLD